MLELIVIASGALVMAMFLIRLYRWMFAWKGVRYSLVSLSGKSGSIRLSQQQGFVRITALAWRSGNTRSIRSVKLPWGW